MVTHTWYTMVCHVWVSEGGSTGRRQLSAFNEMSNIDQSLHHTILSWIKTSWWVSDSYNQVVSHFVFSGCTRKAREMYQWGTSWGDTEDQRTQLPGTGSLFSVGTQSRSRSCWRLVGTVCGVWPGTHWKEIINNLPGGTQNATCLLKPVCFCFQTCFAKTLSSMDWHKVTQTVTQYKDLSAFDADRCSTAWGSGGRSGDGSNRTSGGSSRVHPK